MEVKRVGDKPTITVELSKEGTPSSTGKSVILYSSRGFQWVEGLGISLNIIRSKR